jgi:acetate CoA/acetoacetate CoA-transferase beta subunit
LEMGVGADRRYVIARRAAQEIAPGMVVHLGIGIPTLVADFIPNDWRVMFFGQNGILGAGPTPLKGEEDANLCNTSGYPVTAVSGASFFDSTIAYGIIRRGLVDLTILGALEVSQRGDLANWIVPGEQIHGIGGAMELAERAKKVVILMNHCNKQGRSKILKECTLPLTAKECIDMIITEMAVIEVTNHGLVLKEVLHPYSLNEVIRCTDAALKIDENLQLPD